MTDELNTNVSLLLIGEMTTEGNIFAVGRLNLSIKSMTLTIAGPPHISAGLEGHTTTK